MDRRRPRVAGVPGTLWDAKNVQISRGGDIERPKRFTPTFSLPAGQTFGLAAVKGQVYTFGSAAGVTMPNGIQYQQLSAPNGAAMTAVLDVKTPNGQLYVIAKYLDGNIYHFLNGTRVTDWDALATSGASVSVLAAYLADLANSDTTVNAQANGSTITLTARTPGVPFTVSKSTADVGGTNDQDIVLTNVQSNVTAAVETRATSTVVVLSGSTGQVTDIAVHGTSTMAAPVAWTGDVVRMATAIAQQINNKTATSGYSAVVSGANVTISAAPGLGATANEYAVAAVVTGDVLLSTPSMSGGVNAQTAVAQIVTATLTGTFQPTDVYTLTINNSAYVATGQAAATGYSLMVFLRRVWSTAGSLWEYSKLNTFNNWNDATAATGSGFLNISNEAEGSEPLVGGGVYLNYGAIFSRRNCRIYNLSTDATTFSIAQAIDGVGALAARAICTYGAEDLIFLDETGIRSLRARDALTTANVNDIGVAIDSFVRAHIDATPNAVVRRAVAIIEPRDGRLWLALGNRIYVLSFFPGSEISAWTYFEPGFSVSDFARAYNQLYARAGDTVYLYGGATGQDYPVAGELPADVALPFAAGSPPKSQICEGIDIASTGEWIVDVLTDPNNENATLRGGVLDGITYGNADIATPGRFTHIALRLRCTAAGPASISNVTIHHDGAEPNA
ncbi:hypothetical protein [Bradyrhizobium diazoefficiens]|uniref:hypothetical protein n=1 Tax=Bradyrhizobium diazoefficiens TaxID=1355477 RepID=UPI0035111EA4